MSTTPSTFNAGLPAYTVVGGGKRNASSGICAVLMNRGVMHRKSCFRELQKSGFDYVLSMENSGEHFDIEELSGLFPFVRFILFKEPVNIGQKINVAALEADTPLFFVLWNDFCPVFNLDAERIVSRLRVTNGEGNTGIARLCTMPVIQKSDFELFPCARVPLFNGNGFESATVIPVKEGTPSLYPFEAAGVYDRVRFINMGGFDTELNLPYWQFLDFGFRAWLWGEEIRCTQHIRFMVEANGHTENYAAGGGYFRFYLKNLAPVIQWKNGKPDAHLPLRRFPPYLLKSGGSLLNAWRTFTRIRLWVASNGIRFVNDVNAVSRVLSTAGQPTATHL
ncbi:MAG: hypothetical protein LBF80_02800 [Spirochaetaceae bacterium]|nr:hypothetical protein [Spirochaetaceae bacterium]